MTFEADGSRRTSPRVLGEPLLLLRNTLVFFLTFVPEDDSVVDESSSGVCVGALILIFSQQGSDCRVAVFLFLCAAIGRQE